MEAANLDNSALNDSGLESGEEYFKCQHKGCELSELCEFCKLLHILEIFQRKRNYNHLSSIINQCIISTQECRLFTCKLFPYLARFDFSPEITENGYRTFVNLSKITASGCLSVVDKLCQPASSQNQGLIEEFVDFSKNLALIQHCLKCIFEFAVTSNASNPSLFTSNKDALDKLLEFSSSKEDKNITGFHGKLVGYQMTPSMRKPLNFLECVLATFSHVYKEEDRNNLLKNAYVWPVYFIRYFLNPCKRAERIATICEQDPLQVFMNFWRMQEQDIPKMITSELGDQVEVNLEISIPTTKLKISTEATQSATITVLPPTQHIGIKPIMTRLISHRRIAGAVGSDPRRNISTVPVSNSLIFQAHGGGFVAQSSNSHLVYLKSWAKSLSVPILSIDYSLSPEAPYPRALHETFYAYVWALQNLELLGSTGQQIIFVGDSAGGLLLEGVLIICIELGIRKPDGILLAYTPQLMETSISPSRLLCLTDPLVPYHALAACLRAYLGKFYENPSEIPSSFIEGGWEKEICEEQTTKRFETLKGLTELDGVTSNSKQGQNDYHSDPLLTPDFILKQFPKTAIITSNFDPCMDDCIEMAKRLRDLQVDVKIIIKDALPHGFLNFSLISDSCLEGSNSCVELLKELLFA